MKNIFFFFFYNGTHATIEVYHMSIAIKNMKRKMMGPGVFL